jgi:diguanylate cyclase (GGDEF)-like protein/PAS domain S-box-containing protein
MQPSSLPSFEAVFRHLPDAVFLIDPLTSDILDCNDAALHQVGFARDEIVQHSVLSLQRDVVGIEQWGSIAQAIRDARGYYFIGQHRHKSGAEVPVEVHTSCFVHEGRELFLSIARDITQRVATERDMANRDVQLGYALSDASDGLWDWNLTTNEVFFSPQLKRMLGYGPQEMPPELDTWADNVHPDDAARVQRVLREHIDGIRERYTAEYRLRNRNGHYLWVHDRGRVCERDANRRPTRVVGMVENITDRKNTELALQEIAAHDVLTGLLNRRECERILQQQLDLCRRLRVPMGLCLFDLDWFKNVNDRFGHAVGDTVLRGVAQLVKGQVRSTDYLFRWGGEEFLMLCTDITLHDLVLLANQLRSKLESVVWPELGDAGPVTCSFGVAVFPDHGHTVQDLFMSADSALYRAKANGRNRVECAATVQPSEDGSGTDDPQATPAQPLGDDHPERAVLVPARRSASA